MLSDYFFARDGVHTCFPRLFYFVEHFSAWYLCVPCGCRPPHRVPVGDRAGLTIRGPHTNVRRGPFLVRSHDFLICDGALFSKKSWRPFFRGLPGGGGPSHGTTGTMDNPALVGDTTPQNSLAAGMIWNSVFVGHQAYVKGLLFCCRLLWHPDCNL